MILIFNSTDGYEDAVYRLFPYEGASQRDVCMSDLVRGGRDGLTDDHALCTTFGPIATIIENNERWTVDTDKRWDFYKGFRFQSATDAILFKLKYR